MKQLDFLGYHISKDGIQMDAQKVHTVVLWHISCYLALQHLQKVYFKLKI